MEKTFVIVTGAQGVPLAINLANVTRVYLEAATATQETRALISWVGMREKEQPTGLIGTEAERFVSLLEQFRADS